MNEEKFTSGRGGKRPGAGRPKGTTGKYKEVVKKMYSFRLSEEEEEKAVRELLAKIRGKLILLLCLFMLGLPTLAEPLKATVTYTEENARIEAFEGVSQYCPFTDVTSFQRSLFVASIKKEDVLEIQEFNSKLFKVIPYKVTAVIYKDLPHFAYYYEKTKNGYKGVAIEIVDAKDMNYPIKTIKYDAKTGKLATINLTISDNEGFVFDADKKPIAHWLNDTEYTSKITRKLIYSAQ